MPGSTEYDQQPSRAARALRGLYPAAAAACLCLTGCVSEAKDGAASVYTFAWYVPVGLTLLAVAALAAGGVLAWKKQRELGAILLVAGVAGLAFAPNWFVDRAVVDDDHVELRTGFWFYPQTYSFRFDDVREITGSASTSRAGGGSYTDYTFRVTTSDGSFTMPVGEVMMRGPVERIVKVLDQRRIPHRGYMPIIGSGRKGQTK
jgi:hypothetical protein